MRTCRIAMLLIALLALAPPAGAQGGMLDDLTRLQPFLAARESSANPDLTRNGDARSIKPGETLVLANLKGPGVITHIWCTVGSVDPFYPRSLVLRIYWEGMDKPSVEAPLGDFFGVGHGALSSFTSLPVAVSSEGRARNCFWRMPFRRQARVTVTNESATYPTDSFYYYVDWQRVKSLPADTAYFHARYRQEFPAANPDDYLLLETTGRGHYVGTVYSAHQMEKGWFGEGDDRFYVDGEARPSLSGTGTEDYFGDAWGFRQFSTPFYGVSLWEGYLEGDRVTAYRWHIADPVPFTRSLRVQMEHRGSVFTAAVENLGQFLPRQDWLSSVAFWYQTPPVGPAEPLPPAAQRIAPYRVIPAGGLTVRAEPSMMLQQGEEGLTYLPGKADAALDLDFTVEQAGTYQVSAILYQSVVGARYQPLLDGKPLGPVLDLCIDGADYLPVRLDLARLEAGKHTLRFEGRGASERHRTLAPPMYAIGINSLILLRLEDMAGFHAELDRVREERKGK